MKNYTLGSYTSILYLLLNFMGGQVGYQELVDQNGNMPNIPPYEGPAINEQIGIELGNSSEF